MYAGHFAVGLALSARYPKVPLAATMLGVGVLDLLDGAGVALRIERMAPAPELPLGFSLDFIDWDHSLAMALVWSALWGAVFFRHFRVAFAAAFSHWLADLLVHNGDLALYPHSDLHFGFGLWGALPVGSWFIEGALAAALALWWWRRSRGSKWVLVLLAALHVQFSPWLSGMKLIARELPDAVVLHGLLVLLGFLLPGLAFVRLMRPESSQASSASGPPPMASQPEA